MFHKSFRSDIHTKQTCKKVVDTTFKGALSSIRVEHVDVSSLLPRTADSNGLVIVKLKRKLEYRGHVLFEPVRTRFIVDLLSCLK